MTYLSILRPLPDAVVAQPTGIVDRRAILCFATLGAAAAGTVLGQISARGVDTRGMETSLIYLLRFMAALKAVTVVAMLALTCWRLTRSAGSRLACAYGAAVCVAAAAPGLIWSLSSVALGAVLFHVGLVMFLVLAWRDDAVELTLRS